jgi:hypothetical protein
LGSLTIEKPGLIEIHMPHEASDIGARVGKLERSVK